jgi:hypothetical protein
LQIFQKQLDFFENIKIDNFKQISEASVRGSPGQPTLSGAIGEPVLATQTWTHMSLDWFKGKSTGNHGFYHQI